MEKAVILLIIGLAILLGSIVLNRSMKKDLAARKDYPKAYGIIDRMVPDDRGNVRYYVSFETNSQTYMAQTEQCTGDVDSLRPGDKVKISYYFPLPDKPWAVILDERVTPTVSNSNGAKVFISIGAVLLVIAVATILKTLLG